MSYLPYLAFLLMSNRLVSERKIQNFQLNKNSYVEIYSYVRYWGVPFLLLGIFYNFVNALEMVNLYCH